MPVQAFASEENFRQKALPYLRGLADGEQPVIKEFRYTAGRTDVVLPQISDTYLSRRVNELGLASPIDGRSVLQTFLQIHRRRELTRDYFIELGDIRRQQKLDALGWLKERGYIIEDGDKLRRKRDLRPHVTTSIAIELKLTRWREAIRQAYRAKSFSNYQFICMPEEGWSGNAEARRLLDSYNIGLILCKEGGQGRIEISPSRGEPFSPLNRWRLNEEALAASH